MWTIESERRYIGLGTNKEGQTIGWWDERDIARKNDGTTIGMVGSTPDHTDRFKYQDSARSFEFLAYRRNNEGQPTDFYLIPVFLPRDMNLAEACIAAQNMREALFALPPDPVLHKNRPVTKVIFDWHVWNKEHPSSQEQGDLP